jgi:hypothetical protein
VSQLAQRALAEELGRLANVAELDARQLAEPEDQLGTDRRGRTDCSQGMRVTRRWVHGTSTIGMTRRERYYVTVTKRHRAKWCYGCGDGRPC